MGNRMFTRRRVINNTLISCFQTSFAPLNGEPRPNFFVFAGQNLKDKSKAVKGMHFHFTRGAALADYLGMLEQAASNSFFIGKSSQDNAKTYGDWVAIYKEAQAVGRDAIAEARAEVKAAQEKVKALRTVKQQSKVTKATKTKRTTKASSKKNIPLF